MSEFTPPRRISTLAAIAFVIAWIPFLCVPAFVLAWMARREIREHHDSIRGRGLTTAGLVIAAMTPVLLVFMNVAYRKNLENYHLHLEGARAALGGLQSNSFLRSLPESREDTRRLIADISRLESNPPSFFNPFDL